MTSLRPPIDLTEDLRSATALAPSAEVIHGLLTEALDALSSAVPHDLSAIFELVGDELLLRTSAGRLAGPHLAGHRLRLSEFPSLKKALLDQKTRVFTEHDHKDGDGDPFDGVLDFPPGHSCMVVPLVAPDGVIGVLTFDRERCELYSDSTVRLATTSGKLLAMVMTFGAQSSLLGRLKDQLEEQNRLLIEELPGRGNACKLLEESRSHLMRELVQTARRAAAVEAPVLVTGETGTGKEVLANAIHGWSPRRGGPFVSVNCAALPPGLIESELFGHVPGAFSGATRARIGRFQAANGGTLLLDEIGELPLELQPKLLRALQEGTFEPVGSDISVRVDVRIVAATNRDLEAAVAEGRFREDLFYRLNVLRLHIPPLRERREDIPVIAAGFLAALAQRTGRGPWTLSESAAASLAPHPWPGNVRELVNALERATIVTSGTDLAEVPSLASPSLPTAVAAAEDSGPFPTLEDAERRHVEAALRRTRGRIYGEGGAAEILDIHPNTLLSRMRRLGMGGARDYRKKYGAK